MITSFYKWSGSEEPFLDTVAAKVIGKIILGRYGGRTTGNSGKNEDGALIWESNDYSFVTILDGHNTSESVNTVLSIIESRKEEFESIFALETKEVFVKLQNYLFNLFNSSDVKEQLNQVVGETSCLICFQKNQFLLWFSIGDNLVYLLHPELKKLHQYNLNTRQFFEWVGERSSFALATPCYSTGIRELRTGNNTIVLITDGLLEFGDREFENGNNIYNMFYKYDNDLNQSVLNALTQVQTGKGIDSATIIAWSVDNKLNCLQPGS